MRGVYAVSFDQQSITLANGDYDLFELLAADDKPIEIVALFLGNKSEIKDAEEEMLAIKIVRGNTTTGNGGAATPRPLHPGDAAASFTAETVASTPASAGTAVDLYVDTFNVRAGMQLIFPPDMRPKTLGTELLCVRLPTAVTDDLTLSGTLYVREL